MKDRKSIKRVGKKAGMSAFFFAAAMSLALGGADYAQAATDLNVTGSLAGVSGDSAGSGGGGGIGAGGSGGQGGGGVGVGGVVPAPALPGNTNTGTVYTGSGGSGGQGGAAGVAGGGGSALAGTIGGANNSTSMTGSASNPPGTNTSIGAPGGAGAAGAAGAATANTSTGGGAAGDSGANGSSGVNGGSAGNNGLTGGATTGAGGGGSSTEGQSAGPTYVGNGIDGADAVNSALDGGSAKNRGDLDGAMDGTAKTDQATNQVNFLVDGDGRIGAINVDSGDGGLGGAGGRGGDGGHGGGGGGGGGDGATNGETNGPGSSGTLNTYSYGADGGQGGRGQAGGNGGDGGTAGFGSAGAKGQSVEIDIFDNISSIQVNNATSLTAGSGADGGRGGDGGHGGSGGRDGADSATASGSKGLGGEGGRGGDGAAGGHGADGGAAGDIRVTVHTSRQVTFADDVSLTAGAAGNGVSGGSGGNNSQTDFNGLGTGGTGGNGGNGGAGGDGGHGGDVELRLLSEVAVINQDVRLTANSGGNGGNGSSDGMTNVGMDGIAGLAGQAGDGGQGGTVKFQAQRLEFNNDAGLTHTFSVRSGDAGADGVGGLAATRGVGGDGGDALVTVHTNMEVNQDTDLRFTKGSRSTTSVAGKLDVEVLRAVVVAEDKTASMLINGDTLVNNTDNIYFNTLELQKASTFTTANTLGEIGQVGNGGVEYAVKNLYVHNNAAWTTAGTYWAKDGWSTFNMTDIRINNNHRMLNMADSTGVMALDGYDPVKQHVDFMNNSGNERPFLESAYELKRLHLGTVVLNNQVDSAGLAGDLNAWGNEIVDANGRYNDQEQADHFAYNSGLRRYYWDIYVDGYQSSAETLNAHNFHTADGYKTYLQGALASTVMLNQSFFNTVSPLINDAAAAEPGKTVVNVKVTGSSIETDTGSSVDVDGFTAALALSHRFENDLGATTIGLFGEYGYGSYDTYTSIANFSSYGSRGHLNGEGDAKHYGAGLFARHDFNVGTYLEGSFRAGGTDNEFDLQRDTRFNRANNHNYDSDRSYFGFHLGLGHKFEITDLTMLDVYGKFLWTRTDSDSFTTDFGEHVNIDSVDSIRHRIGGRLSRSNEAGTFKGFVGLAWEHEYDGKASGTVGDRTIGWDHISNAPDVKGSSGFGELGLSFMPSDSNYSIDLSVFGLAGEQEGFGGTLGLKFDF